MPTINRNKQHIRQMPYRHNNQSAKYYNSKYWQNLRNSYIVAHPLCEECLMNDIVAPAEHVHHIKEFLRGTTDDERWSLLLDSDNLMSVCVKCHKKLHNNHNKV
jgi:5-methylcytosine-specific restriction protein A